MVPPRPFQKRRNKHGLARLPERRIRGAADGVDDGIEQHMVINRLAETGYRPGLLCDLADVGRVMGGNQDDRNVAPGFRQQRGQDEAADSGHPHVGNDTRILVGEIGP